MTSRHGLDGKVVVLTGAAGGIGRALAAAFAAQGTSLVLVDRDAAALQRFATTLPSWSPVLPLVANLNQHDDTLRLAQAVAERHPQVDVLVNNAGAEFPTPIDGPPGDSDADAVARWATLLDNNVVSMLRLTRALLPQMRSGSNVINQSSIWGQIGVAGFSAYSASKHAVIGLTRSLAFELAPRGIRVNAVCPGWIRTDAAMRSLVAMAAERGITAEAMEREIVSRQALPQMLQPADIAGVFLFLASSDAGSLTGQSISASHGEVML